MCGIIGRLSAVCPEPRKTLEGIKELEYRGYDSYGVLLYDYKLKSSLFKKDIGELDLDDFELDGILSNIEIGHTRWATHGRVSQENAHPHFDDKRRFFVVMNGIIENYSQVREKLEALGYEFESQTDTEVIPHLYSYFYEELKDLKSSLIEATKKVILELRGEFSFLIKHQNQVLGYKNINPIIVGVNKDEIFISSDSNLVEKNSYTHFILDDDEFFFGSIDEDGFSFEFYDIKFNIVAKPRFMSSQEAKLCEKSTSYYMQKEILEQKEISHLADDENMVNIDYLLSQIKDKRVIISGAGTSYHAALFLHYTLIELGILSQPILASELKNYKDVLEGTLIVVFSQSGETADLIYPLRELKGRNEIFTISNAKNSTLDRLSKRSVYLNCQKEVAVASTKAFTSQMLFAKVIESMGKGSNLCEQLREYERLFDEVLERNGKTLERICTRFHLCGNLFFLGRDKYYPLALEGALKLKEISYIHAEGFAGGELKHGSLALIESGVPVVVIGEGREIISNATETKTRGGVIIGINDREDGIYDYYLEVPSVYKEIFSVIIMQQLSLDITLALGHNPDKPRNLAKSVTVK